MKKVVFRFSHPAYNKSIPFGEYEAGVREGLSMYSRYFNIEFIEKNQQQLVDMYIIMYPERLPGYGLAVADRYGSFGYRTKNTIYIDSQRNLVSRDQVRNVIAHEYGHLLGASHTSGRHDIMHINGYADIETFSRTDYNQIIKSLSAKNLKPWNDKYPPWIVHPTYDWQNSDNKYDVNNDGRVTALDSLIVINAINKGIVYDEYIKPPYYYDVNGDGQITALDSLLTINKINRDEQ
jgi:hypothetical protein